MSINFVSAEDSENRACIPISSTTEIIVCKLQGDPLYYTASNSYTPTVSISGGSDCTGSFSPMQIATVVADLQSSSVESITGTITDGVLDGDPDTSFKVRMIDQNDPSNYQDLSVSAAAGTAFTMSK